jgi:hypothetical protein
MQNFEVRGCICTHHNTRGVTGPKCRGLVRSVFNPYWARPQNFPFLIGLDMYTYEKWKVYLCPEFDP